MGKVVRSLNGEGEMGRGKQRDRLPVLVSWEHPLGFDF